jgi:putative nucleotidyltransferase with HDIG domain
MSHKSASKKGQLYIAAVIVTGFAVIGHSLLMTQTNPPGLQWFVLAALTLLTGSFTVKVPSLSARLSVSETFVFTSTLLFGPAAGTITVLLDALVISFWLKRSTRSVSRVLFNVSAPAVAIWTSAQVFFKLSGVGPGGMQSHSLASLLAPLFVFAFLYFLVNTWLVAGALSTERSSSPLSIWFSNFTGLSINYFVGCSIAALLVAYTPRIDLTVLGIIIPLLLISYITFRSSMGRLEDANKHVAQLNDLYLSTIETLAMAVDAKDQITHGHIRRVQVYAMELAKRVGVKDERQLRAIEAAALLHDMGKLAIPEHILNKPGKLTVGEFDKMKRHADIGADLLSSIPFPYPVVPIVRHHHENWDGTGYPNRIAGTDIPLGARILSVVDCFDALTSDRPYRPRLSNDEAFQILHERRGTMYDPLVVDAFFDAFEEISPAAIKAGQLAKTLVASSVENPAAAFLGEIRGEAAELASLAEARKLISKAITVQDAVEIASQAARQYTPATVVAVYTYVAQHDVLRCSHAAGDPDALLVGLEMQSGERTTGWCAAHQQTVVNSAASLDLGARGEAFKPSLKSSIATPMLGRGGLVGVLTLYSTLDQPYNERNHYFSEQLATLLAEHISVLSERSAAVVRFPEPARAVGARKK